MSRMSRRKDSLLPWIGLGGFVMIVLGWAVGEQHTNPQLTTAEPWLTTAGVLALVTAGLVAWAPVAGGVVAAGLWLAAGGWFLRGLPPSVDSQASWPLLIGSGLALVAAGVPGLRSGRRGSRRMVRRWSDRSRRHDGVASVWQVLRHGSRFAVRRKARVLRPALGEATTWQRLRTPTREYATRIARVGGLWVWSACEFVTVTLGGPRKGKTGAVAGRILDAPGAVIATSTRTDLIELTSMIRARRGPVYVFNPAGIGGTAYASTISFDPLSGCKEPKCANDRAADLLSGISAPGVSGGDREFWSSQARRVLAALLHAAALGELSMRDVLAWVATPGEQTTQHEIQRLLRRSSEPNYEADALQFLNTNDRTRSSITATVMPALSWMTDPTAEASAREGSFDVPELLRQHGTVYMLGAEDAQTAPLVTALTGHVAREARRVAGLQPSGRLDPPLTLALDEAAIICPVPLDQWTADMGGRNITIHVVAQSRAQLRQRFGDAGCAAILNNAGTLLVFGGTKDPEDLQALATLAGERDEDVATYDRETRRVTSTTTRRVPVLAGAQIAQLPPGRALVYRDDMPVAVGHVPMAWKRRDVRWAPRRERLAVLADAWAARWWQFRTWARPHLAREAERVTAHLARVGERIRQIRIDRAWRRMAPRLEQIEHEHEPEVARVIALPARRDEERGEDT